MKRISLVLMGLVSILACSVVGAEGNVIGQSVQDKAIKSVRQQVATCNRATQYFKFNDIYPYEINSFYMLSEEMNTDNSLAKRPTPPYPPMPHPIPKGESETFTNTFTGFPAMHTGALHVIKSETDAVTFCSVTFACDCPANANYCYTEAITNGVHCTLDGYGTSNDPFVINIQ